MRETRVAGGPKVKTTVAAIVVCGALALNACGDGNEESEAPTTAGGPEALEVLFVQWGPPGEPYSRKMDLATISAADGTVRVLSETPEVSEKDPARSPDGSKIAYSHLGNLEVIDADGTGRTVLTDPPSGLRLYDGEPAWSPDGKTILFTRTQLDDDLGENSLMTIDAGGGEPRPVELPTEASGGVWSPDGSKLAYTEEPSYEIVVADADGGSPRRVTDDTMRGAWDPTWSPDGERIAFQGDALYVVDADGSNLRRLDTYGEKPDWSPDGTQIVFEKFPPGPEGKFLSVIDADGSGGEQELTTEADIPKGYGDYMVEPDWYSSSD
jgi:Tol biopolymer transport system component